MALGTEIAPLYRSVEDSEVILCQACSHHELVLVDGPGRREAHWKQHNSGTPMDELAIEAKEAAQLIASMHATLRTATQLRPSPPNHPGNRAETLCRTTRRTFETAACRSRCSTAKSVDTDAQQTEI
ncbi:MAG TPA: hypothetical protein VGN42_21365 [Pirellulales bacterium]|jgi:hypothetical protein|nr:hypothetical protein [Pirellulales bacterium]